ncbi:MAG: PAS domain S-box protein [Deltaproteobacteria bacterium]|nr:PAS domain S-box protein [Deltaproteobacteria bacterium]
MEGEGRQARENEIERLRTECARMADELENLRIQNLFLNTVFNGISEEIMVLDREFTVRDVNRVMLDRYGMDKAAALGRKCFELKEACGAPCHMDPDSGCPLTRAVETETRVETRYRQRDAEGRQRDLSLIMYPIHVPGEAEIHYFMEIARDETRYRTLIEELRGSRRRFRSILDTATNAILSIDENHRITLFNNAAERIFGYTRDEVMGEDLGILIPAKYGNHRQYVQRFLERRQGSLVGRTISLTALRKSGEEFPVELSLSFLEMESGVTITAIIRDITDRKHLEKKLLQSERLAAVGEAVAHVVHELKSPLMIIGGFTNQIQNTIEDEHTLQKLGMIIEEVARVERLVGELGDFTREYRLIRRQADVNSVLRDVVKFMGAAYPPDLYTFVESLDPDLREITCDPDKLKQVFINIITNGIEAMSRGGVITINSERIPHGIEIRISDEGRGIPEDDLQQIFEPFFTTRERGSGLGLAISYKIVQAHGGDISVLNRPGKGATFVIRIPRFESRKE